MGEFGTVEDVWVQRLGTLRNVVRQHVIEVQLAAHAPGGGSALDVGCGQGDQATALALRGYEVTGVDPSVDLLDRCRAAARRSGVEVELLRGTVAELASLLGDRTFDVVCAHGLLMYLPDPRAAFDRLVERVAPAGLLSITFRNGDALAYRPGVRGRWREAIAAFDSATYVNELGATAAAQTLEEVATWCSEAGLDITRWYGVRVFTDGMDAKDVPDRESLADCLAAEVLAGARDPYRRFGSQLHVLAQRV